MIRVVPSSSKALSIYFIVELSFNGHEQVIRVRKQEIFRQRRKIDGLISKYLCE